MLLTIVGYPSDTSLCVKPRKLTACKPSVLAPTRASGISRHSFGQGRMLLTIVGYPSDTSLCVRSRKLTAGKPE